MNPNQTMNKFNIENQDLLETLLESYFLDDDQLDYLHKFYKEIFTINDGEQCLCNSGKKWSECCQKKLKKDNKESYIHFLQTINNPSLKKKYIIQIDKYHKNMNKEFQSESCLFYNCDGKKIGIHLYNEVDLANFKQETNKKNGSENLVLFVDFKNKKHIVKNIDEPFLDKIDIDKNYKLSLVCIKHKKLLENSEFELSKSLKALIFKIHQYEILNKTYQYQVVNFYNSLEITEQVFLVIKWREVFNILLALYLDLKDISEDIENRNEIFVSKRYYLPISNNFIVNDVIFPPITPVTFRPLNSINNPFLSKKPLYINSCKIIRDGSEKMLVTFKYRKEFKNYDIYFKEWMTKFKNNKQLESWISGVVISLADHMLIQEQWFNRLKAVDLKLLNLHYYYRFEHPNGTRQEMIIQTFYNNLHKSINIFNKTLKSN